jgi:hypothetical protein
MRTIIGAALALGLLGAAGAASAEQWIDYSPAKGVWVKTFVHVEPSKIDDYLVALKKTWVPSEEMAKKRGLIDRYLVQVQVNPGASGPNVVMREHYVSMAALDPDKDRDMAMQKDYEKMSPKATNDAEQADRGKYRTLVSAFSQRRTAGRGRRTGRRARRRAGFARRRSATWRLGSGPALHQAPGTPAGE